MVTFAAQMRVHGINELSIIVLVLFNMDQIQPESAVLHCTPQLGTAGVISDIDVSPFITAFWVSAHGVALQMLARIAVKQGD